MRPPPPPHLLQLVFLAITLSALTRAEGPVAAPGVVDGQRALATVKVLASDEFQGRKTGLDSGRRAEEWMAKQLATIGLERPNRFTYFHDFKANVTTEGAQPKFIVRGGGRDDRKGVYLQDYVTLIYAGEGEVTAPIVFVGYGIHAPKKGWDDYAGLDVKGKIVMAVRGKPEGSAFSEERFIGYKSSTAANQGAAGFLLVEGDNAVPGTIQEKYYKEALPAVWLSRRAADGILARAGRKDLQNLEAAKRRARAGHASVELSDVTMTLAIQGRLLRDRAVRNVVGLWRGTGESDEYVVLGAHLDHVGTDAAGNVYNGADDNGSGSAMLLEVARAITATGKRFRRHILFVWFAGEEQGLLGSWAFVKKPPVPLDKIAVVINTDMVGQGKPVLAIGGAEIYPRDAAWLPRPPAFKTKAFRSQPNSDHYPFQARGVPAFFVHTQGPHPNYHQPDDDWQNIKPKLLEISGRYVRALGEHVAQSNKPHCRPRRLAEYLWHDAKIASLWGGQGGPGVDLSIEWFEHDFENLGRALARATGTDGDVSMVRGHRLGASLRDLKPGVFFGVKGTAAVRHHRVAQAAGVTFFGPWLGPNQHPEPIAWPHQKGAVLCLHGAPETLDLDRIKGPILLSPIEAERWQEKLATRKDAWLVTLALRPLKENKPFVWKEVTETILLQRKRYGAHRVVLTPLNAGNDTFARQAPTLIPGLVNELMEAGLKRTHLYPLLGGNLVRFLETALRK